jgi:hypothetical protein
MNCARVIEPRDAEIGLVCSRIIATIRSSNVSVIAASCGTPGEAVGEPVER